MKYRLLALLSDGAYHSGEFLGKELNVSRAAVWKHIKQLLDMGLNIKSVRGKGYCWSNGGGLLSKALIVSYLDETSSSSIDLNVEPLVDSTNSLVMAGALDGKKSGFTCISEGQTAGRGRRGRQWASPIGQNVYMSTLLRVSGGASALQGLSLVVGVSIAEVINQYYGLNCQLKWPNDIVNEGKKVGGILIELSGDISGECSAIIGLGVNVNMMNDDTVDIGQPWVSLATLVGEKLDRNILIARFLNHLQKSFSVFSDEGFKGFTGRWSVLDTLYGSDVKIMTGADKEISGKAQGVDVNGGLVVDVGGRIEIFHGGEVSVRRR